MSYLGHPNTAEPKSSGRGRSSVRANILFSLYYQAGPSRSLVRLRDDARLLGVRISLATLKRYSSTCDWQARVARLDEEAELRHDERSLERIAAMNERQSQLGRSLQGAAATSLQSLLRDAARLGEISPAEIARLADIGSKLERLALGEATERRDIITSAWNVVVRDVVELFCAVNGTPDPDARAAEFARGLDDLVDRHLATGRR
jgi:hypothetical protein